MDNEKQLARKVFESMYKNDLFSQWLKIECLHIDKGSSKLQMKIRKEMLNGFGIVHGGITFSLADSAFAFASNSYGKVSLSLEGSISYLHKAIDGDILIAEAEEINLTNRTGLYNIKISNQENKLIAVFKGIVFRTEKKHDVA